MKKLLSLLTTFSLSSAIGINVIGCQTNPFDDFPGNNQVAKTAAPAVINAVNNFLMYNVLYMKGDSAAENKFYYNYQNISQNQWMRYPSLELWNPWTNYDQGTAAVNSLAVAVYSVTLLGNEKDKPTGINGAVARIMPAADGTLFQTSQNLLPSAEFIDTAMVNKAKASAEAKRTLKGYYQINGKAKIHQYGYSVLPDLSTVDFGPLKKDYFTTNESESNIKDVIVAELDKESNIKVNPDEIELVIKSKPTGSTSGEKLVVGNYELTLTAKANAKTVQGTGNFSINVVDQSKFKFDLTTISAKGFNSNLTVNNTVGDLKKAVQQYIEGKVAPAVKKDEIEYQVEKETDDTKKLLEQAYNVTVAAPNTATSVTKKIQITVKVVGEPMINLDLTKFTNKIPAPSFLNNNFKEEDLEKSVKAAVMEWLPKEYRAGISLNTVIKQKPTGAPGAELVKGEYIVTVTPSGGKVTGSYEMKVNVMQFTTNETIDLYWAGVDIPVANITNG
ncbi:hypothetical protein [Spiroplasma melliferum]|uniref:Lipoprotein n=2 Tax=Spiroplasma melliferum TaxID=2134 RepID=A0AAI9T302_SPIME|nr:hypothetical protein [Spiroplasma melliferum]KAI92405.1 hypothetical protein SPM_004350 [Spiroplasma melliferum KC3]QCO23391.1 hypothetical protein SRED_001860 [Spiroplasma melliferum]